MIFQNVKPALCHFCDHDEARQNLPRRRQQAEASPKTAPLQDFTRRIPVCRITADMAINAISRAAFFSAERDMENFAIAWREMLFDSFERGCKPAVHGRQFAESRFDPAQRDEPRRSCEIIVEDHQIAPGRVEREVAL